MIVVNLPVVFCVWLSWTLSVTAAGAEQVTVPLIVTTPVFALTAMLGLSVSVTVAKVLNSNAPTSHVRPWLRGT